MLRRPIETTPEKWLLVPDLFDEGSNSLGILVVPSLMLAFRKQFSGHEALPLRTMEEPPGSAMCQADGCFRISARARRRAASAGDLAVAAVCSRDGAMFCNLATLFLFMWEDSALWTAFCKEAICFAGRACERDSWSR